MNKPKRSTLSKKEYKNSFDKGLISESELLEDLESMRNRLTEDEDPAPFWEFFAFVGESLSRWRKFKTPTTTTKETK